MATDGVRVGNGRGSGWQRHVHRYGGRLLRSHVRQQRVFAMNCRRNGSSTGRAQCREGVAASTQGREPPPRPRPAGQGLTHQRSPARATADCNSLCADYLTILATRAYNSFSSGLHEPASHSNDVLWGHIQDI